MHAWSLSLTDRNGNSTPPGAKMVASAGQYPPPGQLPIPVPVTIQVDRVNAGRALLIFDDRPIQPGPYIIDLYGEGLGHTSFGADFPDPGPNEAHALPPHPGLDPFPVPPFSGGVVPFPSRADAINMRLHFQGLWVESAAFSARYAAEYGGTGPIPFFGGALQDFAAAGDLDQVLDQILAVGDTHAMIYLDEGGDGYDEPGQPYGNHQLIPNANMWGAHGELMRTQYLPICDRVIDRNLKPVFVISGEGQDGYQWIKQNFQFIVATLGDRKKYGPVLVAWDGVWPASWTVDQMKEMIPWMRSVLGDDGYLGFFFAADYLWVEDEDDYTKGWMDGLDIVFTSNGPESAECPSLANKAGYMLRDPNFAAANCYPDQKYHFLFNDCSRGPRAWLEGEYATYPTVRDPWQTWKGFCDAARTRSIALGCQGWG